VTHLARRKLKEGRVNIKIPLRNLSLLRINNGQGRFGERKESLNIGRFENEIVSINKAPVILTELRATKRTKAGAPKVKKESLQTQKREDKS
jgi:hypothetical protein